MSGEILTRISAKSLITQEWKDAFYVIKKGVLYIYRTRVDYQYNPEGTNAKRVIPITHNLRVLPIKAKEYRGRLKVLLSI